MSILIDENTPFIIQGITGREASIEPRVETRGMILSRKPQVSTCGVEFSKRQ
jgi:hypothetical protein